MGTYIGLVNDNVLSTGTCTCVTVTLYG